eukprot:3262894-Rhodomonas_salina.1
MALTGTMANDSFAKRHSPMGEGQRWTLSSKQSPPWTPLSWCTRFVLEIKDPVVSFVPLRLWSYVTSSYQNSCAVLVARPE